MPIVTSITPQKSKKRVNIYLDDKFGFGLSLETYVKLGLKVDQELSESDVERIVKEGEFQSTYDKILRFATLRPRSEKEFRIWLIKHKVHESLYEELFDRLKRLELMDDKKFAVWWIEQRLQFKSRSKKELTFELRFKGINNKDIDEVLADTNIDERSAIKKLLVKKERLWKSLTEFEKRQKIYNYLAGKGFGFDVIKDAVGDFLED